MEENETETIITAPTPKRRVEVTSLTEKVVLPRLPDYHMLMRTKMRCDGEDIPIDRLKQGNIKRSAYEKDTARFLQLLRDDKFDITTFKPVVEIVGHEFAVLDGCSRIDALAMYFIETETPLRERTVKCRVFTPLTDVERLFVSSERSEEQQPRPLTTIETALLLRKFIGEDLSSKQRHQLTKSTISEYAKTASPFCLVNTVLILIQMPLLLFSIMSSIMTKFNRGEIKYDLAEKERYSFYYNRGFRDFHNTTFLQLVKVSFGKIPLKTQEVLQSLADSSITVAQAMKELISSERPLHELCRKKRNERILSDDEIASKLFPDSENGVNKLRNIICALRKQAYPFRNHHLSAVMAKIQSMAESRFNLITDIEDLELMPDVAFLSGLDSKALTELLELSGNTDETGKCLVFFINIAGEIPESLIDFSTYTDEDSFNNEKLHAVGLILSGSNELSTTDLIMPEIQKRKIPLRRIMPNDPNSFQNLTLGSKNVLIHTIAKDQLLVDHSGFELNVIE